VAARRRVAPPAFSMSRLIDSLSNPCCSICRAIALGSFESTSTTVGSSDLCYRGWLWTEFGHRDGQHVLTSHAVSTGNNWLH
jgi:hypothetical protein